MPRSYRRSVLRTAAVIVGTAMLITAPVVSATATPVPPAHRDVSLRLITFNDLHGNLQPPAGGSGRVTLADGTTVDAGGLAYLATHVEQLQADASPSLVLSAGDNIGASPLASALFHDEPTIDALNEIGVDASAVGNHEFDEGYAELLRIQRGGCHPTDGCQFEPSFEGADFPVLGANVFFRNGRPALLPFTVKISNGIPVGIIGATLKSLPDVVVPSAVADLRFTDEVNAIDRTSRLLERFGVKAQIVLMHQGDETTETGGPNACNLVPGADLGRRIATRVRPQVDAFFAGHTHEGYNCTVDDPAGQPRPLIEGASFGRLLSVVDLTLNTRTHDVVRTQTVAHNEIVTRTVTPDPAVQKIIDRAVSRSAPIANRKVGTIAADIVRTAGPSGESPLGDVIADGQLAATRAGGAQIAITNPGGIRADLSYASSTAGEGDGVVTYGEAFTVQPFSNIMQTITLTGAQLKAVLEQQANNPTPGATRVLQISDSLHYTWTASAPVGSKVSNLTLDGIPIDPATGYRVSVNNFLAAGGDGFTGFTAGTDLVGGPIDLDAFTAYLAANPNLAPPPSDRITLLP